MFLQGNLHCGSTPGSLRHVNKTKCCPYYLTLISLFTIFAFFMLPMLAFAPNSCFIGQAQASTALAPGDRADSDFSAVDDRNQSSFERQLSSTSVANGVTLSNSILLSTTGKVRISTLAIDLSNARIHLGVVQAYDHLIGPGETVSSMANRTGAVAGINGDFFEVNGPGRPIGMLTIKGRLLQSPTFYAVFGITQSGSPTISHETFSASVTNGKTSHALDAVNIYNDGNKGKLVLLTPELGGPVPATGDTVALLQPIAGSNTDFIVQGVQSTRSHPNVRGRYAPVGGYHAGSWLAKRIHRGDHLTITENTSPDDNLSQAIGGGPILVKDGVAYHDDFPPAPGEVSVRNPLTAISTNRDGTQMSFMAFDGRSAGLSKSIGLTHAQATSYLLAHGVYDAMLFDTGGSTVMVSRLHHQNSVSVINSPSDGFQRPVANGLFIYSA